MPHMTSRLCIMSSLSSYASQPYMTDIKLKVVGVGGGLRVKRWDLSVRIKRMLHRTSQLCVTNTKQRQH